MRSSRITTLLILIAFVLGLALGGQTPRQASAQNQTGGVGWKNNGETLVLSNLTPETVYLVNGVYEDGATPPEHSNGIMEIETQGLDSVTIYSLKAELECDPRECRRCENGPFLCPVPPRPIPEDEIEGSAFLGY